MAGLVTELERQADETERLAAKRRKVADIARELGEEGFAELLAMVQTSEPNGSGNGNGHKAAPQVADDAPKGRDAVRAIVATRTGIWTFAELKDEMLRREWFVSDTALEAAAKRLCDLDGEGKRIGKGRYVFPANHGEEEPDESRELGAGMIAPPLAL